MDHATPNLPSRSFDATIEFYAPLGFEISWRDAGWMILERGTLTLEFFPYPDLDPASSSFGSCLRLDNLDAFYETARAANIPERQEGWPRLTPPRIEPWGGRIGFIIDPDGSLLRLIDNSTT